MNVPEEVVLAELLRLMRNLGRAPTYRELGSMTGQPGPATVRDAMARLRAAGVLRDEVMPTHRHRIALTPAAHRELARIILDVREPEAAAVDLLRRSNLPN